MKKLMYMTLAAILTMSFSMTTIYADKNGKGRFSESWKQNDKVEKEDAKEEKEDYENKDTVHISVTEAVYGKDQKSVTESVYGKKEHWQNNDRIHELKELFKENHKDKEKRKEILRKIAKLRTELKNDSIPVFIKGNELDTDVPPVIKDGRTLIPVRAVTNALGAEVGWIAETRTATVTKTVYSDTSGSKIITIQIRLDSDIVMVDGKGVKIDVPAQIISERTMVPLRFIAETFKQKVEWDEVAKTVIIEDED